MKDIAVIGIGFGDEGKGRVVNDLCAELEKPLVIRFSGGHQAGHHVVQGQFDHVFSNFGSGTLQGAPTYWSKNCTVEPIGLMNEYNILREKDVYPLIYINRSCPITTPYDIFHNAYINDTYGIHGTCGVGFGATLQREEDHYSLLFGDIYYPSILKRKLELICEYYGGYRVRDRIEEFMARCGEIAKSSYIIPRDVIIPEDFSDRVWEGSQGLMLDKDIGFFPHVTRANVGVRPIVRMGYNPDKIILVSRAYQTRHGNGPMTNESRNVHILDNPFEKNPSNGIQGAFKKSMLDVDLMDYAILKDKCIHHAVVSGRRSKVSLFITCADLVFPGGLNYTFKEMVIHSETKDVFAERISKILGINVTVLDEPCIA